MVRRPWSVALRDARARGAEHAECVRWPAIVLRTPKGWTGPRVVDGVPVEGTFRAHQVPLPRARTDPEQLAALEQWMRSYRPDTLFDDGGRFIQHLASLAPRGDQRMGANPHANGGRPLVLLLMPKFPDYGIALPRPAVVRRESTRQLGQLMRDVFVRNAEACNFRLFCPDETNSNRLTSVFDVENRNLVERRIDIDDHLTADGRVMEVLSEHPCEGWLEGYLLTGRHGLFVTYESFAMVCASMIVQHTKWLEEAAKLHRRAPIASLNILLTSTCWRNGHNGFSHQGPGLIDVMLSKRGSAARIYLPPDANSLRSVADHCLRSHNYVNIIVIDKQPQLHWLSLNDACVQTAQGASTWAWASTPGDAEPKLVLACAGDTATLETVAAAWWLRRLAPELRFRVVKVIDLRWYSRSMVIRTRCIRSCIAARIPGAFTCAVSSSRARRRRRPLRTRSLRRSAGDPRVDVDGRVSGPGRSSAVRGET